MNWKNEMIIITSIGVMCLGTIYSLSIHNFVLMIVAFLGGSLGLSWGFMQKFFFNEIPKTDAVK